MRLPIRNNGKRELTIFVEPWCEEYELPPGGVAMIRLDDGRPHSIDIKDDWVSIWDEGGGAVVEIVRKDQKDLVEALQLARIWLFNLGARKFAIAMDQSVDRLERREGYLNARAQAFTAFHTGFMFKDAETRPPDDALPKWPGNRRLASSYQAGGTAAWLNHKARTSHDFPGPGVGPYDTDTVRSAFERAHAVVDSLAQ